MNLETTVFSGIILTAAQTVHFRISAQQGDPLGNSMKQSKTEKKLEKAVTVTFCHRNDNSCQEATVSIVNRRISRYLTQKQKQRKRKPG